jgi:hypothetical protein
MTAGRLRLALAGVVVLAAAVRVWALFYDSPIQSDQFFQYLEPAWLRLTGAGIEAWEWRDGVRSWVLPGYHGAWIALLRQLGLRGPTIGWLLQAHWAAVSLCLVWAGWRGGALLARRCGAPGPANAALPAGWQGGLLGALLAGGFPLLASYSIQTLSEVPSMLAFVCALVLTGEVVEAARSSPQAPARVPTGKAVAAGALAAFAVCARITNAPLALVPVLWMATARQRRPMAALAGGALAVALLFGIIDRLTWGQYFISFIRYVRFNFLQSHASDFGVSPHEWYLARFAERLRFAWPLLIVPALAGLRGTWPFTLSAAGLVAYLSAVPHKEERFVVLFWPLFLIAAAGGAGAWVARQPGRRAAAVAALAAALVLVDGAFRFQGSDYHMDRARLELQAVAGQQADLSGLIVDEPFWTGGYLWLGQPFPQVMYNRDLLANRVFNYALLKKDDESDRLARAQGFEELSAASRFVLLRRAR